MSVISAAPPPCFTTPSACFASAALRNAPLNVASFPFCQTTSVLTRPSALGEIAAPAWLISSAAGEIVSRNFSSSALRNGG